MPAASDIEKIVRAYDFAGTLKSDSNPDPDYTASCKMAKLRSGEYVILEVCRLRARYHDITKHIIENAIRDGIKVDIIIPQDPGAAGKAAATMQVKDIVEAGFYATTRPTSMNKIDRFKPFSAASQAGLVKIMKGCANDLENKVYDDNSFYYNEMEQFNGGRKNHDDHLLVVNKLRELRGGLVLVYKVILSQCLQECKKGATTKIYGPERDMKSVLSKWRGSAEHAMREEIV